MHGYLKFCVLVSLIIAGKAHTASFNCNKSTTFNERIVCNTPELSQLDDEYAALYKEAREGTAKAGKVRKDAIAALNWREANCRNEECLLEWYQNRITSLQQTTVSEPQQTFIDPMVLFRTLNIRTFESSLAPRLKSLCGSYFFDVYPESAVRKVSSTSIEISHDNTIINLEVIGQKSVKIDETISNGSYRSSKNLDLEYYPEPGEWRANKRNIPIQQSCNPGSASSPASESNITPAGSEIAEPTNKVPDPNLSEPANTIPSSKPLEPANKMPSARRRELEGKSIGEFNLTNLPVSQSPEGTTKPLHQFSSILVYKSASGKPIGTVHITLLRNPGRGTQAAVRMLPELRETLPDPSVIYRAQYYPSLLVFEQENDWYNLSSDPSTPAWINLSTKNAELKKTYKARLQVVADASEIKVHSAHRMRAGPSTDSEILLVLNNNPNESVYPVEIEGDWMKVHYVSPSAGSLYDADYFTSLGSEYTQLQGWIKWRQGPGDEYIDVLYNIN